MKYTKKELLDMKAEELNKVLLRQPVYMISDYGGALLFGAIDEEKMCGGWKGSILYFVYLPVRFKLF